MTGGHDTHSFVNKSEVFDLDTEKWTTKAYFAPNGGGRIDPSCGSVRGYFQETKLSIAKSAPK